MDKAVKKAKATKTYRWPQAETQSRAVLEALAQLHGLPKRPTAPLGGDPLRSCGATPRVVEALVATILSQNTTQKNSQAAMDSLMRVYAGDFDAMRCSSAAAIAKTIVVGGLSNVKGARIHSLLQSVHAQHGQTSLEHLHDLDDEQASRALLAFDGVGPKTASCVLLFCLGRDSFAVDTHVLRICKRLGWVAATATREQAFAQLDATLPQAHKYPLHVLMVTHGKCCPECAANQRPQKAVIGPCPLQGLVRARQRQVSKRAYTKTTASRAAG